MAERYGQIIQTKARIMKITANLPDELWLEVWITVGYLYNRTSLSRNDWKASIEAFNAYLKSHNILFNGNPDNLRLD